MEFILDVFSHQCRHISRKCDTGLEYRAFHHWWCFFKVMAYAKYSMKVTMRFWNFEIHAATMRMFG